MFAHNILAVLALAVSVAALPTNTPPQSANAGAAGSAPSQSCTLSVGGGLPVSGSRPVPLPTPVYGPQNGALPVSAPWGVSVPRPSPTGGTLPIGGVLPPGGTLPVGGGVLPPGGTLPIGGGVLPSLIPYPSSSPSSSSSGGDGSGNQNVGNGGQNAGNSAHSSGSVSGDVTVSQATTTCGNAQLNCCNKTVKKGDTTNSGLLGALFGSGDVGVQCSPLNIPILIAGMYMFLCACVLWKSYNTELDAVQIPINTACGARAACCQGDTTQVSFS